MTQEQAIVNLDEMITAIEKARIDLSKHHIVKLVAVSKYSTSSDVETLYNAGQRAFGENKVQDFKEKSSALDEYPLEWHFIGSLQKNKINNLIDLRPSLMQSLHSMELALELNKKLEAKSQKMSCLLQINSAKEDSKSGVMPQDAIKIYDKIQQECPNIKLKGVMSIGAHTQDKTIIKESFIKTHDIFTSLQKDGATICSMGMSSDFELAIECGSNMIRVGSKLFK
ncbi:MAG: YggS family pyridoxal phosphate-dependent enzyme [Campylobacterota bacterium]|nr:YggS family pyridoxal phosphate-dependent enzyme [Campylobacterota bacterium]